MCVNATFSQFRLFAQNSSLPNINEAFSRHKPPFFTQNWMELLLCYTGVMTLCYGSSNSSSDGGRLNWGRSAWGSRGWYKFRNCLIFPRKGCKKSLEMYRIFFLNSSFIDLFFKRQLTGCSNSSFLNDYYVVCPPQLKCSFHKSGASTYINAMLFKKELWWQKNNPCLSKTTREGAGCPHQKSNCHMSTDFQIFCTCYYDFWALGNCQWHTCNAVCV